MSLRGESCPRLCTHRLRSAWCKLGVDAARKITLRVFLRDLHTGCNAHHGAVRASNRITAVTDTESSTYLLPATQGHVFVRRGPETLKPSDKTGRTGDSSASSGRADSRRTKASPELGVQLPHTTKLPVARSLAQRRICLELADVEAGQLLVKALAGTSLTCSRKVREATLDLQRTLYRISTRERRRL